MQAPKSDAKSVANFRIRMRDIEAIRNEAKNWDATPDNRGDFDFLPNLPLHFAKLDGGWVIYGSTMFKDRDTLLATTRTQYLLAEFDENYIKAIGHKGISADDIRYQMAVDFSSLLGLRISINGQPGSTNRFDINRL